MRSYQQNTVDDIAQRSKGVYDTSALMDKKLGNIESKFQGLEDRVIKIEAALREVRAEGHSHKDDHKDSRFGTKSSLDDLQTFNKRLVAIELKVQENHAYGSKSTQYKGSEDVHNSDIKALTKMIQTLHDNQANLQAELNAIKRTQTNSQDNKLESRQSGNKHYLQSPLKVRFEGEPTDSEEDKKYYGKKSQADHGSQVSPYSPPRQRDYLKSYGDFDGVHTGSDNGGDKKDLSKRNPYSNIAVNDTLNKKYDFLRSESTKHDASARIGSETDYGKKSLAATDGFEQKFKPKVYGDDLDLDKRKISYNLPVDTQKKADVPASSQLNFKRPDSQHSSGISSWSKSDYFGTIEAAVQQAKAKNTEDIEKFKKILNRENEDRFAIKERPRTALDKYPQSEDERSLIKLQSAMPKRDTTERFGSQLSADAYPGSRHVDSRGASRTYSDHNEQPGVKHDNVKKEQEEKPLRVSSYLGERSRVRSTSMYDARPLAEKTEIKQQQERTENRISEEKRKQIEQDIERKIRDETERRRRENVTRGSADHPSEQLKPRNFDDGKRVRENDVSRSYLSKDQKNYAY